ncbi:CU044_5270 family protein [Actinoallomurus sp. NPDC052308]|uniref:CU044_5270 family protein n=1 Tax=Actinoallomurus sp. NPDC052308 TaxID=3155530 RepID=UPI00341A859B
MKPHPTDDLVRTIAHVHDDSLAGFENRPAARELLADVTALDVTRNKHRVRRRPVIRAAVACGVAATVAAGAIVLTRGGGSGPTGPSTIQASEVAQVTSLVAAAARKQPDLHPRDDQFIHVKSVEVTVGADVFDKNGHYTHEKLPPINRELWLSVDGHRTGLLRETPCPPGQNCDDPVQPYPRTGAPAPGSPAALRSLPTDRVELLKAIDTMDSGVPRPELRLKRIQGLIMEHYLPPKVRAAIFEVLGDLPGATIDRDATDAVGRPGIAISVPDGIGGHVQTVFDRRTYQYLGTRSIAGPPAGGRLVSPYPGATPYRLPKNGYRPAAGTVTYAAALLSVDVADQPPAH